MIPKIETHVSDALKRLLYQYKDKPNIRAFVTAFAKQFQELEDASYAMFLNRSINDAVGAQLDGLGEIVGIKRSGMPDDKYRIFIKFQVGINTSKGLIENIISLFKLVTSSTEIFVQNEGNGSVSINYAPPITDTETRDLIYAKMEDVVAGGVRINAFIENAGEDAFAFAGGTGKGFGDVDDPDVGGKFASIEGP